MGDWSAWGDVVAAASMLAASAGAAAGAAAGAIDAPANATTVAERGEQIVVTADPPPDSTPYGLPVADAGRAAWGDTHAAYPATDVFLPCGATVVSPVHGTLLEVRRDDAYDPAVDNPATRGGRSVSILGFDGVRYYLAHFDSIGDGLAPGDPVGLGDELGRLGDSGRASACHLHFSISPPCPGKEWSVRRGAIWPHPYLDAWRRGEQRSPVAEVERWLDEHPDACATAMSDPYAGDA